MVLFAVRGWVDSRSIVRPEGMCQRKIPMTPSRNELATFRVVARCLNQLRHLVPFMLMFHSKARMRYTNNTNGGNKNWFLINTGLEKMSYSAGTAWILLPIKALRPSEMAGTSHPKTQGHIATNPNITKTPLRKQQTSDTGPNKILPRYSPPP
jgi:hypothetical protein